MKTANREMSATELRLAALVGMLVLGADRGIPRRMASAVVAYIEDHDTWLCVEDMRSCDGLVYLA